MYTEQVLDAVKDFIEARLEAKLVAYETAMSKTVTRLSQFDFIIPANPKYPIGTVYDTGDDFVQNELDHDQEEWKLVIEVGDMRNKADQLRTNLYAHRDAIVDILRENPSVGDNVLQAYVTGYEPPLIMRDDSTNYMGAFKIFVTLQR